MPRNILSDVMKDWTGGEVKKGYEATEGLGKELGAKAKMVAEGRKALMPDTPVAPAPKTPAEPSGKDKISPKAHYGDKPGEKRIDVSGMTKPLGSFKKGGEVPKTGVYKMHEGEHVLTSDQKGHMKNALSLAEGVLSHDAAPEPEPPKKEVREMRIRRGASGGHIIQHSHVHVHLHPDEEHVTSDGKGLLKHVMQHMAGEPESSQEEAKESPDVAVAEAAAGIK